MAEDIVLDSEATNIKIKKSRNNTIKERRAMLRKVLFRLHRYRIKKRQKEAKKKNREIDNEIRYRVYKIFKNLIYEKFSKKKCERETMIRLFKIINICNDRLNKELFMFNVYTKMFTATFKDKLMMRLRNWPLIGGYCFKVLTNRAYLRYDMLLIMNITLTELLESESFFKFEFERWDQIVREIQREGLNFMNAQTRLFAGNLELVRVIQTKKVAQTVLNLGYELTQKLYGAGEIEQEEKKKLTAELRRIKHRIQNVSSYIRKIQKLKNVKKSQESQNTSSTSLKLSKSLKEKSVKRKKQEIMNLRKKWTFIFPILNELDIDDLSEFRNKLIHGEMNRSDRPIQFRVKKKNSLQFDLDLKGTRDLPDIIEERRLSSSRLSIFSNRPISSSNLIVNKSLLEDQYFYLIKSGMLQLKSMTGRVIKNLTASDYFGSCLFIGRDVGMTAECLSKCKFYKIPLTFVKHLADKYPLFSRAIYSEGLYNYLKSCSYILSKTKNPYFRQLRRIAYSPLTKLLKEAKLLKFNSKEGLLTYFQQVEHVKLTIFMLEGSISITQENIKKRKKLNLEMIGDRHSELLTVRNSMSRKISVEPHQSINISKYQKESPVSKVQSNHNFSVKKRKISDKFSSEHFQSILFEENKESNNKESHSASKIKGLDTNLLSHGQVLSNRRKHSGLIQIMTQFVDAGNAFVIHLNHLEDIDILSNEVRLFVFDTLDFGLGKIKKNRKRRFSAKIKRRRFH